MCCAQQVARQRDVLRRLYCQSELLCCSVRRVTTGFVRMTSLSIRPVVKCSSQRAIIVSAGKHCICLLCCLVPLHLGYCYQYFRRRHKLGSFCIHQYLSWSRVVVNATVYYKQCGLHPSYLLLPCDGVSSALQLLTRTLLNFLVFYSECCCCSQSASILHMVSCHKQAKQSKLV